MFGIPVLRHPSCQVKCNYERKEWARIIIWRYELNDKQFYDVFGIMSLVGQSLDLVCSVLRKKQRELSSLSHV